jgi:hypothetical protein
MTQAQVDMSKELQNLLEIERKAWNRKMRGSEVDASTIYGQEGKNETAWRAAADACYRYRAENGMLGR